MSELKQSKLFKKKFNQKYPKLNLDYLGHMYSQMNVRKSKDYPNTLSDTSKKASEYLAFLSCWNEYVKVVGGFFQTFDTEIYKDIYVQTEEYCKIIDGEDVIE